MLNNFVRILLGCIHEFVSEEYLPIVDAASVPVIVIIILIFVCALAYQFAKLAVAFVWSDRGN